MIKFVVSLVFCQFGYYNRNRLSASTGDFFSCFVENFDAMFARAGKGRSQLWIHDHSQNCAAIHKMLTLKDAELMPITTSPDVKSHREFLSLSQVRASKTGNRV